MIQPRIGLAATACFLLLVTMNASGQNRSGEDTGYTAARARMVDRQIRKRGITDQRVLDAMAAVPRHHFVPDAYDSQAYDDHPLPIGHDQTISQPYIVALMTAAAQLDGSERVLEIGTGSGYQAAVLSLLTEDVYSIEIIEPLARQARQVLADLGYKNVEVRIGDGYKGWPEEAPFDVILVTAAPETVPQALLDQLADGGRMIVPVGAAHQELFVFTREGENIHRSKLGDVRFVPMVHEEDG